MATSEPLIPVGIRLPLASEAVSPAQLLEICGAALDLGYASFWVGDHLLLPESSSSAYPHTASGERPFSAQTPWADPLLKLTWLAAQLPTARFGTSIMILTLRNPVLLAKQLSTLSWLTERPFSFGVGTGWLRDEYDAVGMPFEKRATRAKKDILQIKELLAEGRRSYAVRDEDGSEVERSFSMLPIAPDKVEFLWGGFSPIAMRLVAAACDGWLPAKQTFEELEGHLGRLRAACEEFGRDFSELRLVAKPGPGPTPPDAAVDRENIARYAALGFDELIVEMPYEPDGAAGAIAELERVAARTWL